MDVFKVPSVFCHASVIEATELWFVGHISKRLHAPPKFNSSCMPITILQSHCDSALKYSNTDMPYTYNKKLQHKVILVFSLKCYCFRKKNVKYIWRINDQYAPNEFLARMLKNMSRTQNIQLEFALTGWPATFLE